MGELTGKQGRLRARGHLLRPAAVVGRTILLFRPGGGAHKADAPGARNG